MTKQGSSKDEPLRKILGKGGWQETEKGTWKHPQRPKEKITVDPMGHWTHLELAIIAPQDYRPVATGIGGAELKKILSVESS